MVVKSEAALMSRSREDDGSVNYGKWQEREEDLVESKLRGAVWKCGTECGR